MIFTGLAPNTEIDDTLLALWILIRPWSWRSVKPARDVESELMRRTNTLYSISFESGRTALHALLAAKGLSPGDEVLIQSYTCVAVPNSILWAGATPIYVDIDENLTMSPEDLVKKITPKSKAVIIQHTFGMPAKISELIKIAREKKLFVIEDCAHALGAKYNNLPVGSFGDAAFFSFGRDKTISSVFGGAVTTNDDFVAEQLRSMEVEFAKPSYIWIAQQLMHPIVMWIGKKFYKQGGKVLIALVKRQNITSRAVYSTEKSGGKPEFTGKQFCGGLASLAIHQFKKLERFNEHRKSSAELYAKLLHSNIHRQLKTERGESTWLRYTIWHERQADIMRIAKERGIFLGDWYDTPIAPRGVDYLKIHYQLGSCPVTEKIANGTVNLPTDIHTSSTDIQNIVTIIQNVTQS